LPDLEGNVVSSSDERFENKVVLFDIWGTWCPPCREMTPVLNELHAKYASAGLEVVGAAFELLRDDVEDPKELVTKYVSENDIRYLMLYGGASEYASSLIFQKLPFREFDGFPTVVLVGRDGKAARVEEDFDEGTAERLEAAVRELLASSSLN
jgi:thiol-disulfide isomerase/thioredoxin